MSVDKPKPFRVVLPPPQRLLPKNATRELLAIETLRTLSRCLSGQAWPCRNSVYSHLDLCLIIPHSAFGPRVSRTIKMDNEWAEPEPSREPSNSRKIFQRFLLSFSNSPREAINFHKSHFIAPSTCEALVFDQRLWCIVLHVSLLMLLSANLQSYNFASDLIVWHGEGFSLWEDQEARPMARFWLKIVIQRWLIFADSLIFDIASAVPTRLEGKTIESEHESLVKPVLIFAQRTWGEETD